MVGQCKEEGNFVQRGGYKGGGIIKLCTKQMLNLRRCMVGQCSWEEGNFVQRGRYKDGRIIKLCTK